MKKLSLAIILLFSCITSYAQMTTITGTVTDSDSTVWINASVSVQFQVNPASPNINNYNINGVAITSNTYSSYLSQNVVANGSGLISVTLLDNQRISPGGSSWKFVIKPQANVQAISYNNISVTGASQSLTAFFNTLAIAPRFPAVPGAYGYADVEVFPIPVPGGLYFNTTSTVQRIWNGTAWQNGATSGGTIPSTTLPLCGTGSAGVSKACVSGVDFVPPNGNVATATALASIPNGCTAGSFSNTFDARGNATNCLPITGFTNSLPSGTGIVKVNNGIGALATACTDYLTPDCAGDTSPGGSNSAIQFNNGTTFGGVSAFTYDIVNGIMSIGSATGTLGTSGIIKVLAPYNNGTSTVQDTYSQYIQCGTGVNPFCQYIFDNPSGSPGGSLYYFVPQVKFSNAVSFQSSIGTPLTPSSIVCTDSFSNLATSGCPSASGGWPSVTPLMYGAYGDGLSIPNGCTTNGTTTAVCPAGPFISSAVEVGKQIFIQGAGTAGVTFATTIAAFVSNNTVTLAATPPLTVTQAPTVTGHDDVVALQTCWNNSSAQNVPCVMGRPINFNTPNGYLISSAGLTIPTKSNLEGSASNAGTTILSEFNGDAISLPTSTAGLQAGQPIEAVTVQNFTVVLDPTEANSRGFHINAAPGVYGFGGLYNSSYRNISVNGPALECLWLDGHMNSDNNPNQYVGFDQFKCNGPTQYHPANLIKITGIQAQETFTLGSVDGDSVTGDYPNPLIWVGEKTSGQRDSPVDVKFIGFTYEATGGDSTHSGGGLRVGDGAGNIHFEIGYVEDVGDPVILSGPVVAFTYRGNNIANSGNHGGIIQATDTVSSTFITGSIADNREWGSVADAALAVCGTTNNYSLKFSNNIVNNPATSNCTTMTQGTGAALLQVNGSIQFVNPSAQAINLIRQLSGTNSGETLALYANGGSFTLATGGTQAGNDYPINLGPFGSVLVVSTGQTAILTLVDNGSSGTPATNMQYMLTGGTAGGATGVATLAGNNVYTGTNEFQQATTFDYGHAVNFNYGFISNQNTYINSNTGGTFFQFGPGASPGTSYTNMWDDGQFHISGVGSGTNRYIQLEGNSSGFIIGFNNGTGGDIATVTTQGVYQGKGLLPSVYTVATLPSASSLPAGTHVTVSDCTTFTPGTLCTGGGSDYMIAVTNGSAWTVH